MTFFGGGRRDRDASPVLLVLVIVGIVLAPIAATLIQLAVSRKREFLADASGALLTRYPDGLASALTKISAYGRQMRRPSNATAHLFIANPFGPQRGFASWFSNLFSTHPPVADRIAALMGTRRDENES
jgi:heat shock protein HtpX